MYLRFVRFEISLELGNGIAITEECLEGTQFQIIRGGGEGKKVHQIDVEEGKQRAEIKRMEDARCCKAELFRWPFPIESGFLLEIEKKKKKENWIVIQSRDILRCDKRRRYTPRDKSYNS